MEDGNAMAALIMWLNTLTAFVNLALAGRCPADEAPVFFEVSGQSSLLHFQQTDI